MTVFEILAQQIDEKVEQLKDAVIIGNTDMAVYQKMCGEIRGLLIARGYVLDLKDRVEKADDE